MALSLQKSRCRAHRRLRLPKVQVWLQSMACCAEDGVEAARACRVLQQPIQSKFGLVARSRCGWGAASLLCALLGSLGSCLDRCLGSFRTRGRTKMKNANERFFDCQNVDSGCPLHASAVLCTPPLRTTSIRRNSHGKTSSAAKNRARLRTRSPSCSERQPPSPERSLSGLVGPEPSWSFDAEHHAKDKSRAAPSVPTCCAGPW